MHLDWLSIRYVIEFAGIGRSHVHFLQVLTGENPFRGISPSALVFHVAVKKNRPSKPSDASTIGFSDSSWDFTQRCWDDRAELRPEAGEVVEHLGEATANWDGLMPPHVRCEPAAFDSGTADSIKYSEFEFPILR